MNYFSRHKKLFLGITLVSFMSFLFLVWTFYNLINVPLLASTASPVIISLDKSTTASKFVHLLKEKQLIKSTKIMLALIQYEHLAQQLKAGVYQINPGETSLHFLHRVAAGDVLSFNFTIIAGTTQKKVDQDLKTAAYLNYDPNIWQSLKQDHPSAEGLLLADTYRYAGGSDIKNLLGHAQRNLITYLNECWTSRAPDLPYQTPYELLVAASIIEKETAVPQERKLISGVVINRLKKRMPLQMDPTVIYAMGDLYKGSLTHEDLSISSPYNTYQNRGLPPTPIAMVGKEAIDAAAHPQLSNYLYFMARGDGTHQFSQTYEEQKQAINQYKRKGS